MPPITCSRPTWVTGPSARRARHLPTVGAISPGPQTSPGIGPFSAEHARPLAREPLPALLRPSTRGRRRPLQRPSTRGRRRPLQHRARELCAAATSRARRRSTARSSAPGPQTLATRSFGVEPTPLPLPAAKVNRLEPGAREEMILPGLGEQGAHRGSPSTQRAREARLLTFRRGRAMLPADVSSPLHHPALPARVLALPA